MPEYASFGVRTRASDPGKAPFMDGRHAAPEVPCIIFSRRMALDPSFLPGRRCSRA